MRADPRAEFTTNKELLGIAMRVPLSPERNRAVFYAEAVGAKLSKTFIDQNPGYKRIDELLIVNPEGRNLLASMKKDGKIAWTNVREIWYELSRRLAETASGDVYCFVPNRLVEDRPVSENEHSFDKGRYASTVFEKIELPALALNPNVDRIFLNGKLLG